MPRQWPAPLHLDRRLLVTSADAGWRRCYCSCCPEFSRRYRGSVSLQVTHEQRRNWKIIYFQSKNMTNCERAWSFLGHNSLILSVLWSYFAFGSQNWVDPGRRVVPSRAFTRVTLPACKQGLRSVISWMTNYSLILARNFSINFVISHVKLQNCNGTVWRENSHYNKQVKNQWLWA